MKYSRSATMLALALLTPLAHAGSVRDSENSFRELYGTYRAALFMTNSSKQQESTATVNKLSGQWASFVTKYATSPPPQYVDDAQWSPTLSSISSYINQASSQITEGNLPHAHETLEAVRDEIGQLHERNNIESFSDRMNAYHAEMEHVLDLDIATIDADTTRLLNEKAAVLSYLVTDITRIPPLEGINNPEYDKLITAFETSVKAFQDATREGGADAIKAAASKLKMPYSKLFLKFG